MNRLGNVIASILVSYVSFLLVFGVLAAIGMIFNLFGK